MKTVGEVLMKINEVCTLIDAISSANNMHIPGFDNDDIICILREYCAILRSIPIKQ